MDRALMRFRPSSFEPGPRRAIVDAGTPVKDAVSLDDEVLTDSDGAGGGGASQAPSRSDLMHTEPAMSRRYRHTACGRITEVSGDNYVRLECPFRGCSGTYCTGCRRFVRL